MPRAGLSRAVVIDEAAREADELGFDRLSLADIARHFDVAVPSLYKHVSGLDAVRRGVAILALRELGAALAGSVGMEAEDAGRSGVAELATMARAYRRYAAGHPGRYAATVRAAPPGDPEYASAADAVLEAVLGTLARRGVPPANAVDAARILRSALHGFVMLERSGGFGLPRSVDESFEGLVAVLDAGLGVLVGPDLPKAPIPEELARAPIPEELPHAAIPQEQPRVPPRGDVPQARD